MCLAPRALGLDAQEAGRHPPQPFLTTAGRVHTPDSVSSHARGDMRSPASVSMGGRPAPGLLGKAAAGEALALLESPFVGTPGHLPHRRFPELLREGDPLC